MKKLLVMILCLFLLTACAFCEQAYEAQDYFDEQGNHIQIYYDMELETWCQITIYAEKNAEGCTVVDFKKMSGEMINTIWWSDWENSVRAREYVYHESGALAFVNYMNADGSRYSEIYDEAGDLLYYEYDYAGLNAEGYRVTKRFLPDGALDHEWWWGENDLYHEIWYKSDGSIDFCTYWYYNTSEADEVYEEYDGNRVLIKRYLFNINENGERERID